MHSQGQGTGFVRDSATGGSFTIVLRLCEIEIPRSVDGSYRPVGKVYWTSKARCSCILDYFLASLAIGLRWQFIPGHGVWTSLLARLLYYYVLSAIHC